jgi:hypothetical protein
MRQRWINMQRDIHLKDHPSRQPLTSLHHFRSKPSSSDFNIP